MKPKHFLTVSDTQQTPLHLSAAVLSKYRADDIERMATLAEACEYQWKQPIACTPEKRRH